LEKYKAIKAAAVGLACMQAGWLAGWLGEKQMHDVRVCLRLLVVGVDSGGSVNT